MKKIKVNFSRIIDSDIVGLLGDLRSTLTSINPNDNIVNDEQVLLKDDHSLLFAFNRGRELNSTLRREDGTDDELTPPMGSKATETTYALINNNIIAHTGTHYSPSLTRFVEYFRKLYLLKNNVEYRAFSIEDIYNDGLLKAIKNSRWTNFKVTVVVPNLPNKIDNRNLFEKYISSGRELQSKTLYVGMTDGITTSIKQSVLDFLSSTSSAYATSDDKTIGTVNLHKYRFTYEIKISNNESLFGTYPQILQQAMNEYTRGSLS